MTRAVDRQHLPDDVRADARATLHVSNGHRRICLGRLGRPRLLRRVSHDLEYEVWNGEAGGPRFTDAEVAREAWALAEGHGLLVARLLPVRGDCSNAIWASRRRPDHGSRFSVDEDALVRAFRALDGYRALAEAWHAIRAHDDEADVDRWDERRGARSIRTFASDGRRFALVMGRAHLGCGDFTGILWALYEETAHGLSPVHRELGPHAPDGLIDLDRDGVPEVLFARRVVHVVLGTAVDVSTLDLGCPC